MSNQQEAAQWAQQMLATPGAVILDTETTGLHDGEIVQISVINLAGETLLDTLVKPVRGIPLDAQAVHGITDEMVASAPGWMPVSAQLINILAGKTCIIYNAVYDRKMLHQSAEKAGLPKVDWKTFVDFQCAMEVYAMFYGDYNDWHGSYRWQRLTAACQQCGIDQDAINAPAHSALGDCLRTLEVIKHMANWKPTNS